MKFVLLLAVVAFVSGCGANDDCSGVSEAPRRTVGALGEDVLLDPGHAWVEDNAIGQLAAAGFLEGARRAGEEVDFAAIDSGAIRGAGLCTSRDTLAAGPITDGMIHEVLPLENIPVVLNLTATEVLGLFEHAVNRLVAANAPGSPPIAPAEELLQVEGAAVNVDCERSPRVVQVKTDPGRVITSANPTPSDSYRVVLPKELLLGARGYSLLVGMLDDSSREVHILQGDTDANLASSELAGRTDPLMTEPRLLLSDCVIP